MNGPVVLVLIALFVGLMAAAARIGAVERRQRLRREDRVRRQGMAEWAQTQRDLAPRPRVLP